MKIDTRTKFIAIVVITTVIVITDDIIKMLATLIVGLVFTVIVRANIFREVKRYKKFVNLLIVMILVQSIFEAAGEPILTIYSVNIITTGGLIKAGMYLIRVIVIFISTSILASSSIDENIHGLAGFGLPFSFCLMLSIGVRFIPILTHEIKASYLSVSIRGIDVKKLSFSNRIKLVSIIFTPVVVSIFERARRLSQTIEGRGYSIGTIRCARKTKKLGVIDYLIILGFVVFLIMYTVY